MVRKPLRKYMGADYTSKTRYVFHWYNPHPYQGTTKNIKLVLNFIFEISAPHHNQWSFCHPAGEIYLSTNLKNLYHFPPTLLKIHTFFIISSFVIKNLLKIILDHPIKADQRIWTKSAKKMAKKLVRILVLVYNLNSSSGCWKCNQSTTWNTIPDN